ncbi:hypothetical protein BDQ17DRAFT_1544654 [Cyathus striatus]|nr:hypothetical protein BDQ17DRAFT_1544654 [Cyathus striatus]
MVRLPKRAGSTLPLFRLATSSTLPPPPPPPTTNLLQTYPHPRTFYHPQIQAPRHILCPSPRSSPSSHLHTQQHRSQVCPFWEFGVELYGVSTCPKDVDITYPPPSNTITTGQIKVTNDVRFFLKMPKDPRNEYRVLWFR